MPILLLNMPFAQLCWANLGLSLLKSGLRSNGIECSLNNLCFNFAHRVGYENYDWLAGHFAFVLGGEHLFAKEYFGDRIPSTEQFWNDVLLWTEPELDADERRDYFEVAAAVAPFLDECMEIVRNHIEKNGTKIIGFTTSYQQTFPSLCLAKRIKERYANIQIVFGGAACEGTMGQELFRQFNEIDFVFSGEADLTFPEIVKRILNETINDEPLPEGVMGRRQVENVHVKAEHECAVSCTSLPIVNTISIPLPQSGQLKETDLDNLPAPDFDDYFSELAASPFCDEIKPYLFCESSRGCWWGEQRQCSFCGLNGHSLRFRRKNPQRIIDELRFLVNRYGVREICFADNIFAKDYFDTFLPMLKESGLGVSFEFEMKANQKKEQTEKLLAAGLGAAQLGIESFSTPILKMLNKGATARHNLQVLKWYTEAGIAVKWNVLYGFPGEEPAEYENMTKLIPLLYHFHPPVAFGRVRIDRFAPYHNNPAQFGIENLRPYRGFRFLYPFEDGVLKRLSYYHEFDFSDGRKVDEYTEEFLEVVKRWDEEHVKGTLRSFDREDGVLLLTDTRPIAVEFQYRLSGFK
ncbi:MAG: RiPP maturation radical SAM C-methyltransferase, partial [Planctomycetaceae bacterium]|nr:RiPP maturation radical SAM C-methyltransferase [Planctomycetaceae bacterium]